MNYPPDDNESSSQPNTYYQPPQPDTSYPFHQPNAYPYQPPQDQPPPYQPTQYYPPQPPPPRKQNPFGCLYATGALIVVILIIVIVVSLGNANSQSTNATPTSVTTNSGSATDTPVPTATSIPVPTISPQELEKTYKALTKTTTVGNLDKDGSSDKGKDVNFTSQILGFVKDDTGVTAGANVDDPNTSGVVQVIFPSGTDLSQLNVVDTLVTWGTDEGTFSGTNGFGATVQEVGIAGLYMTDKTTNYQTH